MNFTPLPPPPAEARWPRWETLLHPAAQASAGSRGRRHPEAPHPWRSPYQRDRARLLHATAFRRLAGKTQVYVGPENDHLRNRLTHTLEVAQLARTAARALGLNEDLTEAVALAHDLGHPPFGHGGERALDRLFADAGGFDHNSHTLRRVERLEHRYPDWPGLNLAFETLEALARRCKRPHLPELAEFLISPQPPAETQLVDACDSIAYTAHDLDDALRDGLLRIEDLAELELWREAAERANSRAGRTLRGKPLARAALPELVDRLADSVVRTTAPRLDSCADPQAVRRAERPMVALAPDGVAAKQALEKFLFARVYRHPQVMAAVSVADGILAALAERFRRDPTLLPEAEQRRLNSESVPAVVRDYLAGMTDRFAQRRHAELNPVCG